MFPKIYTIFYDFLLSRAVETHHIIRPRLEKISRYHDRIYAVMQWYCPIDICQRVATSLKPYFLFFEYGN